MLEFSSRRMQGVGDGDHETYRAYGPKACDENCPAQRDSPANAGSILKTSPYRPLAVRLVPLCGDPYRPLVFKTTPAQQNSGMYSLGMGILRILRILRGLGILGGKTKSKTTPAQADSEISILAIRQLCPYCPSVLKTTPAQQDSEISKLRIPIGPIGPIGPIKKTLKATKP